MTAHNHEMSATSMVFPAQRFDARRAILWGGLIAGVLDATDGVVAFGLKGMNPLQVLQYIASGLLGPASFKGGLATRSEERRVGKECRL